MLHDESSVIDASSDLFNGFSDAQLRALLHTNIAAITVLNIRGQILFANQAAEQVLGLNRSDITHLRYNAPEWHIQTMEGKEMLSEELPFYRVMSSGLAAEDVQHAIVWPNGERRYLSISASPLPAETNDPHSEMLVVAGIRDITEEYLAKRKVEDHNQTLDKLISHLPGMIYKYQLRADGSSTFVYTSHGCYDIFGLRPKDIQEDAGKAFDIIHPDDLTRVTRSIAASAKELSPWYSEFRINHPNGQLLWVEGQSTPERLGDGSTLWYGYFHVITQRKLLEAELERLATTDGLTNLLNRREFEARAARELNRLRRSVNETSALLMIDLDHFKAVNDHHGHSAGDTVLITLSRLLKVHLREHDMVARIGGEEFVVLLVGANLEAARQKAEQLRQMIARTEFNFDTNKATSVTSSIGCASFSANATQLSDCLKHADNALYEAKRQGRNRVVVHV